MSCVCACDQRRQCLENRPIDLEPWIKFSTCTASCFHSRFSIHRNRRGVCNLKSSSANVYQKKKTNRASCDVSVGKSCNLVWIFLNSLCYFWDGGRCVWSKGGWGGGGGGLLVVKVIMLKPSSDWYNDVYCYYYTCQAFQCMFCVTVCTIYLYQNI